MIYLIKFQPQFPLDKHTKKKKLTIDVIINITNLSLAIYIYIYIYIIDLSQDRRIPCPF